MSERVACKKCGKWMFHLAQKCPHCGAPQAAAPEAEEGVVDLSAPAKKEKKPELQVSAEEARSLIALEAAKNPSEKKLTFLDVVQELVMWRDGVLDVALSVLAFPVTGATVATLGFLLVRRRPKDREGALDGTLFLAVPTASAFLAATLWQFNTGLPGWIAFGVGFAAWLARTAVRAGQKKDPLL